MAETESPAVRYECSQCETRFTPEEYQGLERQPVNPEEQDPVRGQGFEKVCPECGAGIHSEKWSTSDTIQTDDGEFTVTTFGLVHGHGLDYDQFYETVIHHPWGDHIAGRSPTKDEAKADHEEYVKQIRAGRYHTEPSGYRLVLEDDA